MPLNAPSASCPGVKGPVPEPVDELQAFARSREILEGRMYNASILAFDLCIGFLEASRGMHTGRRNAAERRPFEAR